MRTVSVYGGINGEEVLECFNIISAKSYESNDEYIYI